MLLNFLPHELILGILRKLSVKDLLNIRKTCRELYHITQDTSLWNDILNNLYAVYIDSSSGLWPEQLRQRAMIAARVDEAWHDKNISPRDVQLLPCSLDLKDVQLLPSGNWMLMLLKDGTLKLQAVNLMAPTVQLPTDMKSETLTSQGSSVHVSPSKEIFILYAFTTGVHLYHVEIRSEPSIQLATKMSDSDLAGSHYGGRAFVGGNIIILLCFDDHGFVQLHLRAFGSRSNKQQAKLRLGVHSEELLTPDQCTIQILSPNHLLLCTGQKIYMYQIPGLNSDPTSLDVDIFTGKPIWTGQLPPLHPRDTSASFYGSPSIWNISHRGHARPLMIWRPTRLFVVEPSPDFMDCTIQSFPAPHGAQCVKSGLRHGAYVTNFPTDGLLVNLFTFPDFVSDSEKEKERLKEKGGERSRKRPQEPKPVVNSFALGPVGDVNVLGSTFDEWSGRVCLFIEDGSWMRRKYIVMVDVA